MEVHTQYRHAGWSCGYSGSWLEEEVGMDKDGIFTTHEFREPPIVPGRNPVGAVETLLGSFATEGEAVAVGRTAWETFRESGSHDVAWWLVRASGEELARWIADSGSDVQRVLDLRTNTLVKFGH